MSFLDDLKAAASKFSSQVDTVLGPLYPEIKVAPVDLTGKRALVTGSNVGIGYEAARALAAQGAEVWLLCRAKEKGEAAAIQILADTPATDVHVDVVDVSSLASVRAFVERWATKSADERKIDVLINNAGASTNTKKTTGDGLEFAYATNFAGHFLLTLLLLKQGYFAPTARIINVTSVAMYDSGKIDASMTNSTDILGDFQEGQTLPWEVHLKLYQRAKASQVAFTKEIQDILSNSKSYNDVTVSVCHPGIAKTGMWKRTDGTGAYEKESAAMEKMTNLMGITPADGAKTIVFLATSPIAAKQETRGEYWDRCKPRWTPAWMNDKELRAALWAKWEADTGVDISGL
ncbi:Riboflavin biosynthesis protein RibBA [Tulasnella sp. 427]|nr:Riboflavin biosynthesis protein RibBA [Tulasnella sp. 427]